ncbi:hypothetical protein ADUPG1_014271 [Aduncisulcus paluster]|uniref:Protein kinase domain-containing protein n=1 Tax=Aduncisulcus paluster TaxID=2918883 RepID=A0ABQ5KBI1_9EUKA|nr:hypothetical protein ADUPG1_014271 [Aduncisulcus paluster]
MSSSTAIQIIKPEFIRRGAKDFCPIPRDSPNIESPKFPNIRAKNTTKTVGSYGFDQSNRAQEMMKGEYISTELYTNISIPFPTSSPIKGAYICVNSDDLSHLIFTFTSSKGEQISKKYEFSKYGGWYFLPVDLPDVILCEITGRGRKEEEFDVSSLVLEECFGILSLVFIREEAPEETLTREAREKLWSEAPVVKPEFVKEGDEESQGRDSIPIPRDDPKLVDLSFSMVKCKDASFCQESRFYDKSLDAQRMLKGKDYVRLSHLSISIPSPSSIKGAYICVDDSNSSPSLLFTFTDCDYKKTSKKYEFTRLKQYEWYFLPIDLSSVILCEIEGKGRWAGRNNRSFLINSLVFLRGDDIPGKPKSNPKHDSLTLTSVSTLTSQCIIGSGGFGEVLLVKVDGIPFPCVLKKMLRSADKTVVKGCRKEFNVQLELFTNPKCFNRIPRPLYILDLLDSDMKGVYGFLMEFCVGGSVSAFSKRWCADGKYVSVDDTADDSEPLDADADFDSDLYLDSCSRPTVESADVDTAVPDFDAMTLNPVKVCSLCVGMIECLDDVFTAKPKLVHRDVKPDNFLVRVDPDSKKCTVVLADLGFVQIQDSVSSSTSSQQIVSTDAALKKGKKEERRVVCGTYVFNSYKALVEGLQSQLSDAHSLGMSILSLFMCLPPFVGHPTLRGIDDTMEFVKKLCFLLSNGMTPKLSSSPLFKTLLTIDGGKYEPVHKVFNEVFTGLTMLDVDKRMSVHDARKKVQPFKFLLPTIGEDFVCPSIDDIIKEQKFLHYENSGSIFNDSEKQKSTWKSHDIP